ncbi:MAG: riboflavin kinase [Candidatus Uhrbacteria bacterium]|nr:riboflavin kinase [Candidatus Uhrbacteria bacterium]
MALKKVSLMVTGIVEHGFAQARNSGYPTANLMLSGPLDIPEGIYCAQTRFTDDAIVPSIVFYGIPHTIPDVVEPRFEVHLLGENGNLYGQELTVELVAFIRDNKKFEDAESLQSAIESDIARANEFFNTSSRMK